MTVTKKSVSDIMRDAMDLIKGRMDVAEVSQKAA
jgi:hypothetical protein